MGRALIAAIVALANSIHIDIGVGLALAADGIGGDDGLWAEEPVDAE